MNTESRLLKYSFVGLSVVAFGALGAACSTSDASGDGTGGTGTTSGGSTGVAGTSGTVAGSTSIAGTSGSMAGTTGSGGSGGALAAGMGVACPTPTAAMGMLTDFAPVDGGASTGSWGDFSTTFSGSIFDYPNGTAMYPLTSDTSMGNWHLTGDVGDYSGFGLVFNNCNKVDLSAFSGITFTISGTAPSTLAGAANVVTLTVGTAADDVASTWLNAHKMPATAADVTANFGRCMPASSQYDGTCGSPTFKVTLTATPTPTTVKWTDLTGGKPSASINPSEVTFISWVLPNPAGMVGTAPTTYPLDITIDDIKFAP